MKKIIFIASDSNKSGVPVHLKLLIDRLKKDFKIILIAPEGWLISELKKEIEILILEPKMKNFFRFRNIFKQHDSSETIIHSHGARAGLVGRMAAGGLKSKIIYTEHNWTESYTLNEKWRKPIQLFFLKMLVFRTDKIVCVSEAVKRYYQKEKLANASKLITIYNGVEFSKHFKKRIRKENYTAGVVATLDYRKGLDVLIRSIPFAPFNINFKILGSGGLKKDLKNLAKKMRVEGKIEWVKDLPTSEFRKQIDFYIQPSRDESFGMALCEAIGDAVPSIASSVGAIPEIILSHELLFRNEDEESLAEKISLLIANFEIFSDIHFKQAPKYREIFSAESMARNYREFYKNL